MSKSSNPWQRLIQFVGAHMHEEVEDDRLDRAVRIATGSLTRNPPFVEDSFGITDDLSETIEAVAVSPKGTIAMVLGRATKNALAYHLRLVTRSASGNRVEIDLGSSYSARNRAVSVESQFVSVFFPEGSDEPALLVDGGIFIWGKWKTYPSYYYSHASGEIGSCLCAWVEDGKKHLAYLDHEKVNELSRVRIHTEGKKVESTSPRVNRWLGLIGGSLARITDENGRETLRWRDHELPVGGIDPATICFVKDGAERTDVGSMMPDHLQFVAGDRAYYWTGGTPFDTKLPEGKLHVVGGRIFVATRLLDRDVRLMEFVAGQFKPVGDTNHGLGLGFGGGGELLFVRNRYVLTFAYAVCNVTSVWLGNVGKESAYLGSREDIRVFTLHGCFCARRSWDDRLYVHDIGIFPLYGTPFDRLTAVEDARGKAIMSWDYTEGTLHVLRYPLPE